MIIAQLGPLYVTVMFIFIPKLAGKPVDVGLEKKIYLSVFAPHCTT